MEQMINYISGEAGVGDQIWGLGDWFHMKETSLSECVKHPMTQKFRDLAGHTATRLIPGNHDEALAKYCDNRRLKNPLLPIEIIKPFWDKGFLYCHGHDFDPSFVTIGWLPAYWDKFAKKRQTPGELKGENITVPYLMRSYLVHSIALVELPKRARREKQQLCKGVVLGHTHLPVMQEAPHMPYLLNSGDMRGSGSFIILDNNGFHLMNWDDSSKKWLVTSSPQP
jgi:UDP-2,3-diacylglucosamine pyrophosphatase LpxH